MEKIILDKTNEEKMLSSIFFVEATSFEQFGLWREYHEKTNWQEDNRGFYLTIGYINDDEKMPIVISFSFAKIYNKQICFYYCSSRFSDSKLVEEYIEKYYPVTWDNGSRRAMTDANNFHHAVHAAQNTN